MELVRWFCALGCFCVSGGVIAFALFPAMKQGPDSVGEKGCQMFL